MSRTYFLGQYAARIPDAIIRLLRDRPFGSMPKTCTASKHVHESHWARDIQTSRKRPQRLSLWLKPDNLVRPMVKRRWMWSKQHTVVKMKRGPSHRLGIPSILDRLRFIHGSRLDSLSQPD
jgi:hypothetical protein